MWQLSKTNKEVKLVPTYDSYFIIWLILSNSNARYPIESVSAFSLLDCMVLTTAFKKGQASQNYV